MGPRLALALYLRPAPWKRARALLRALDRSIVALGMLAVGATALLDLDDVYPMLAPALCLVGVVLSFGVSTYLQFERFCEYEALVELVGEYQDAMPSQAHMNYRWELALVRWMMDEKTQAWIRRETLWRAAGKQRRRNKQPRPRM